jgi:putative ABC transport system substrate-binding protein
MWNVTDPVGTGLIASFAHPGGNVTGLAAPSLTAGFAKRLELLKAIAPSANRVAILQSDLHGLDAAQLAARRLETDAAADALGISLVRVQLNEPQEFDAATATIVRERPDALTLSPNPINFILRKEIADFALRHRLPTVTADVASAQAGILLSYGGTTAGVMREIAFCLDKVFKGAKPGALPVSQGWGAELVINGRTAKALGLTIPQSLLLRANEVIP